MPIYIKETEGPKRTVIYTDRDGRVWVFSGGNRPWRNQNPGNLVPGDVSKRNGAIGVAGGFAIFPSYENGHVALLDSLKNKHGNKDIDKLIKTLAPPKENKTKKYIAFVRKKTGIKDNKKVKDFTPEEFEKLWKAIEQMEGWSDTKKGKITEQKPKKKIVSVKKDKKGIIEYYNIEGLGFINKAKAVNLANNGLIDAVVVYPSLGRPFLRSRPNNTTDDNLGNLV